MHTLDNNDFMILNNIIYKIHTNQDFSGMRKELLEQLKMVLDFDSADFHLAKGDGTPSLVSRVAYCCDMDLPQQYEGLDYSQGILTSGRSMVYRESDLFPDEKRVETEYYKHVYQVNHWHYSLQVVLGYQEEFMGVITFYRTKGKEDFRYADIFLLEMLKEHLAYRIYKEKQLVEKQGDKMPMVRVMETYGLTKREGAILEMLLSGLGNDEICSRASITNNTLKKHILNSYKKLGIKNRVQLFRMIAVGE